MSDLTDDPIRLSPDDVRELLRPRTNVLKDRDYRTRLRREALQPVRLDLTPSQRRWRRVRRVLRRYGLMGRLGAAVVGMVATLVLIAVALMVLRLTGWGLALLMTGWRP